MITGGVFLKPASAKNKGRLFQQKCRNELLNTFPELSEGDIRSTSMGAGGEDLQLSPAARKLLPYQFECKSKARSPVHAMFEQARSHGDHEPVVLIKQDRKETLAVIEWGHFLDLIKRVNNDT